MSDKPTLHEIAAMPFPASLNAMRKYYNPDWGVPVPEGATLRTFSVKIRYTRTIADTEVVQVEAFTAEEAEEKACGTPLDLAIGADPGDEIDIDSAEATEVSQ